MDYKKENIAKARTLRKNMTKEERHLWYDFLRDLPVMVHRQKAIGSYIVDFYIAQAKLVIELDGTQHYDPKKMQADKKRDAYLQSIGLSILRIPNNQVKENFRGVCQEIWNRLQKESLLLEEKVARQSRDGCGEK